MFRNLTTIALTSTLLTTAALGQGAPKVKVEYRARQLATSQVRLEYKVTNCSNTDTIKDFHIHGVKKMKGVAQGHNDPAGTGRWTASGERNWRHWATPAGTGIQKPDSVTFYVIVPGTLAEYEQNKQPIKWVATHDGKSKVARDNSNVITSSNTDPNGDPIFGAIAMTDTSLTKLETAYVGSQVPLALWAPETPGQDYLMLCSFQQGPGIPMPNGDLLPLWPDAMFNLSLSTAALNIPPFQDFVGFLPPHDPLAVAHLVIPPEPLLGGLELHVAAMTLDWNQPGFVTSVSNAEEIYVNH